MGTNKVIHLITLLEMGGAQGNTIYTSQHLDPNRFEVQLWSGQGAYWDQDILLDPELKNKTRFFKFLVRPIHPVKDLLAVLQLWRALRLERPAILHTHSSKAGILGRIAGWLAGVPVIIHTYHGFGFNSKQKPWTRRLFVSIEKRVASLSAKLIFVSRSNQQEAQNLKIGHSHQYALIRSGIPIQQIQTSFRMVSRDVLRYSLGLSGKHKVILTVGPFKPQKNYSDLLRIASLVRKRNDRVVFLVVGDGELRPSLEDQILKLDLRENVRLLGWRRDVPELLAITNVFALTSLWEGLPRSLLEAMCVGVPSLCYDTDGVRDILPQGGGKIIPQGNIQEFSDTLLKLLEDDQSWARLSAEAKHLVTKEFDIDEMVRAQERLYSHCLDNLPRIN